MKSWWIGGGQYSIGLLIVLVSITVVDRGRKMEGAQHQIPSIYTRGDPSSSLQVPYHLHTNNDTMWVHDRQGLSTGDTNHVTSGRVKLVERLLLDDWMIAWWLNGPGILGLALQMTGWRLARSGVAQGLTSYGISRKEFHRHSFYEREKHESYCALVMVKRRENLIASISKTSARQLHTWMGLKDQYHYYASRNATRPQPGIGSVGPTWTMTSLKQPDQAEDSDFTQPYLSQMGGDR